MQKPLNILETSWRNQPTINVDEVSHIPFQLKPIIVNGDELGTRVGIYALVGHGVDDVEGIIVNVLSRSETSIDLEIYSQRNDTTENIFYRYRSGEIEAATGTGATELSMLVDDIFHSFLVQQGVENYDVTLNPNVIPTTVDYVANIT